MSFLHVNSRLTFSKARYLVWGRKFAMKNPISTSTTLLHQTKFPTENNYGKSFEFRLGFFFLFFKNAHAYAYAHAPIRYQIRFNPSILFTTIYFHLTWKMSTMLRIISNAYFRCKRYASLWKKMLWDVVILSCMYVFECAKTFFAIFNSPKKIRIEILWMALWYSHFFPRATLLQKHLW